MDFIPLGMANLKPFSNTWHGGKCLLLNAICSVHLFWGIRGLLLKYTVVYFHLQLICLNRKAFF